jgi:demethylmenaquinone methyltransferase / 2-methoxy-6-polyprenyl-1,4-benzoquinol methylase
MSTQKQEPSRTEIWKMFDRISPTYDTVNRVMTMGMDLFWRKKMAQFLPPLESIRLLDCATGTADQIISLCELCPKISEAIGIDLSKEMLQIGLRKLKNKSYKHQVLLQEASALALPFENNSFDCVTMSFGIRNVVDVSTCLQEIFRVLKPKGRALILETSIPSHPLFKTLHMLYIRKLLPRLGGWISKQKDAYEYLNRTAETFPSGQAFCQLLQENGFSHAIFHPLSFGSVTIYQGDKY